MSVQNIQGANPVNYKENTIQKPKETEKMPEQIKDGDKKIKQALIALGVIAAAGVAIGVGIRKNNAKKALEAGKEVINNAGKAASETTQQGAKAAQEAVQNIANGANKTVSEISDAAQEGAKKLNNNESVKKAEEIAENIKKEAQSRTDSKLASKRKAELTQEAHKQNQQKNLSNKSAKESADVFINEFKKQDKIIKAKEEYQKRLKKGVSLDKRIKESTGTYWGKSPEGFVRTASKERIAQLNRLSKEQIAALDDKTIDMIANNLMSQKMQNFDYLKSLTPEQIINIQTKGADTGRTYLNNLFSGACNTQKDLEDIVNALNMLAK